MYNRVFISLFTLFSFISLIIGSCSCDPDNCTTCPKTEPSPWEQTNGPLGGLGLGIGTVIELDNILIVSTTKGIYRSTNDGTSWEKIDYEFSGNNSYGQQLVYAKNTGLLFYAIDYDIYYSSDYGVNWDRTYKKNSANYTIDVNQSTGDVYAYSGGWDSSKLGEVLKYDSRQSNWVKIGNSIQTLKLLIRNSTGDLFVISSDGIFFLSDDGLKWEKTMSNQFSSIYHEQIDFEINQNTGDLYYLIEGDIFQSIDNGISWVLINHKEDFNDDWPIVNLWTHPINGNLYVNLKNGLFYSENDGFNWEQIYISDNISNYETNFGIRQNPDNGNLYTVYHSGFISFSSDNGLSWKTYGNLSIISTSIISITINENTGEIFAGTKYGVYNTSDDGNNWTRFKIESKENWNYVIASNPNNGDLYTSFFAKCYKSSDNGTSWSVINSLYGFIESFAFSDNNIIFAAGYDGIFRSDNNGLTWSKVQDGRIHSIAIQEKTGDLYFGSGSGVYKSSNKGNTWIKQFGNIGSILSIAIYQNTGDIYIGSESKGIFYSDDDGNSWIPKNNGLSNSSDNTNIRSIAINQNSGELFAVSAFFEAYRSIDKGENWIQLDDVLKENCCNITTLCINQNTGDIYAGTKHEGFWIFKSQ